MRLNLGSGPHRADGWTNVDRQAAYDPDVVASMLDLPFPDGIASQVYAGHVLEHLTYDEELPAALAEIRRVLDPGGELMVVGPCLDAARKIGADAETIRRIWPGDQHPGQPGACHEWPSTGAKTRTALEAAGFGTTELPPYSIAMRWPIVSRVAWQFAIVAVIP